MNSTLQTVGALQLGSPVVLSVLGGIMALYLVYKGVSLWRARKAGGGSLANALMQHLKPLGNDPAMQLAVRALAARIQQFGHDSGHAILDGILMKVVPGAAPAMPLINQAADFAEAQAVKHFTAAPAQPAIPPDHDVIAIPRGHPFLDTLRSLVDTMHQQQGKKAA